MSAKKNPIILHVESTSKNCSISISKGAELLCLCEETTEDFSHSEKLHTFIQWALEGAEIKLIDVDAIAVSVGPGSYTGIRIGTTAAQGLAYALQLPLISVDTLQILAQPFSSDNSYILPVIDARRDEVFTGLLDNTLDYIIQPKPVILDTSFIHAIDAYSPIHVCGPGAEKIQTYYPEIPFTYSQTIPSSENMIPLALYKWENQQFENPMTLEPNYLKPVHITPSKKLTKK